MSDKRQRIPWYVDFQHKVRSDRSVTKMHSLLGWGKHFRNKLGVVHMPWCLNSGKEDKKIELKAILGVHTTGICLSSNNNNNDNSNKLLTTLKTNEAMFAEL